MILKFIIVIGFNVVFGSEFMDECTTFLNSQGICIHAFNCPKLKDIYFGTSDSIDIFYDYYTTSCGGRPLVCCPDSYKPKVFVMNNQETTEKTTTLPPDPTHSLLTPPDCGVTTVTNVRIAGGRDAKLGEFPWMAALGYKNNKTNEEEPIEWMCGGSLITEKHILTVAHCIRSSLYIVRLGDILVNNTSEGANPINILIDEARAHEDYNRYSYENDIAVLSLIQPVGGLYIKPICLPIGDTRTFERYYPFVAGWGKAKKRGNTSPNLKVAMLPIVPVDACKTALKEVSVREVIDNRTLCAGYVDGGIDACEGDSGGPMMVGKMDGDKIVFFQIGAVSWGYSCAKPGYPGVYTRVTHFIDWIRTKLY